MNDLQPHQERVVNEQRHLSKNVQALTAFVAGEVFKGLPRAEQGRLQRQLCAMEVYDGVLLERIEAFAP